MALDARATNRPSPRPVRSRSASGAAATSGSPGNGLAIISSDGNGSGTSDRAYSSTIEASGTPIAAWTRATTIPVRSLPAMQWTSTGPSTDVARDDLDGANDVVPAQFDHLVVQVGDVGRLVDTCGGRPDDDPIDDRDVVGDAGITEARPAIEVVLAAQVDHGAEAERVDDRSSSGRQAIRLVRAVQQP